MNEFEELLKGNDEWEAFVKLIHADYPTLPKALNEEYEKHASQIALWFDQIIDQIALQFKQIIENSYDSGYSDGYNDAPRFDRQEQESLTEEMQGLINKLQAALQTFNSLIWEQQ